MPVVTANTGTVASQTRNTGTIVPQARIQGGIRQGLQENLNFVVIVLDDGGAEWFNWSGLLEPAGGFAITPRLDELRALGVTFTRGHATPICGPSRARLLSGAHGFRLGLAGNIEEPGFSFCGGGAPIDDWTGSVPISTKLLPRLVRLGRNGSDVSSQLNTYTYQQAMFGKLHLCSDTGFETYPIDHGFGRYIGMQPNAGSLPIGDPNTGHFHFTEISQSSGTAPTSKVWGAAGVWPAGGPYEAYNTSVTPNAAWDAYKVLRDSIQWINSRTSPFFALITLNPPHGPYEVPPYTAPDDVGTDAPGGTFDLLSAATQAQMTALDGGGKGPGYEPSAAASTRAVYRANIEAVDSIVGKLWERMEPARRAKTVFVFLGDNGTVAAGVDSPYEAGHGKRSIYEMGTRVPFLVWGPPSVITSPGRTSDRLLHVTDVMPTILELSLCDSNLWNPGGARKVDGRSFARVLRDPSYAGARDHIYSEFFLPLTGTLNGATPISAPTWFRSYSDGTYKLIQKPSSFEFYRVSNEAQPGSGLPGYLEKTADDLYPLVGTPGQEALTARFAALQAAMAALIAS